MTFSDDVQSTARKTRRGVQWRDRADERASTEGEAQPHERYEPWHVK